MPNDLLDLCKLLMQQQDYAKTVQIIHLIIFAFYLKNNWQHWWTVS